MVHVTGPTSILPSQVSGTEHVRAIVAEIALTRTQGEHWKQLRKQFNPGFAPQHLITMLPIILEKSSTFVERLEDFSSSGQTFSLTHLAGNLIFDIISSVVMDNDFGAQKNGQPSEFLRTYRELFHTYTSEQMDLPWYFTPRTEWKRRRLANRIRTTLRSVVQNAFANRKVETNKSRSILSLTLRDVESLTPKAVDEACDQLNTFLFAGHDTTSIMISWMFYELSRTPRALKAVRSELDSLFGPGE